ERTVARPLHLAVEHALLVVLHGGPQPVLVQSEHIELRLLPRAVGHDCPAFVVYIEHQLRRLLLAVPEQLLEDEGHVVHQVDRIVPHDDHPRPVGGGLDIIGRLVYLDRRERRGHRTNSTRCGDSDGRGSGWLVFNRKCSVATQTLTAPSTWTATRTTGTPEKYWM